MITLCGDNCIECPRYNAHTDEGLRSVAELWYKVGWRMSIVSNEEISCSGCSSHKQCNYQLVECTKEPYLDKCNQCKEFSCVKIEKMWNVLLTIIESVGEVCSQQAYISLEKAFLIKKTI